MDKEWSGAIMERHGTGLGKCLVLGLRKARTGGNFLLRTLGFIVLAVAWGSTQAGTTERVSISSAGINVTSGFRPSMSTDGRYVAFGSYGSTLVAGGDTAEWHIYVRDRDTGLTERVSVNSSGTSGNGASFDPSISGDGRYVAFQSTASNLVTGDSNADYDVFVHDRDTGLTERVSVDSAGNQGNSFSNRASISADGRYVAFASMASNLVAGDSSGMQDIFVHDRDTGLTKRVSVSSSGIQGSSHSFRPSISANGRYVAFYNDAYNLVTGDSNGTYDVFVHDRVTGLTERVSVSTAGMQASGLSADPSISADGRYVAFYSRASNLVAGDSNGIEDVFVHDRTTGLTERVSVDSAGAQGSSYSTDASISADGHLVAFHSFASNLVADDTNGQQDVFVHDRDTGLTERVSVDSAGVQGIGDSIRPSFSADGLSVAFESLASNLVAGVSNNQWQVYVRDLFTVADPDTDQDGILDISDNCIEVANPDQSDDDGDLAGDVCDADDDNDGHPDVSDNCQFVANPSQSDMDNDGLGDVCDSDADGDGVQIGDNCPYDPNPFQTDSDSDGAGDECDADDDNDGILDGQDNCAYVANAGQGDLESDGIGDACDSDIDGDGVVNEGDNCLLTANFNQDDSDDDGDGDECDADDDGDGLNDGVDNCPLISNPGQQDTDGDGRGNACDADLDGDGVDNGPDNCPSVANSAQYDLDLDGLGDACDPDVDADGVINAADLCPLTDLNVLVDPGTGCSLGELCPCPGPMGMDVPWRNHGKYVSCVAQTANGFADLGLISQSQNDHYVSAAGSSACGK